MKRVCGWTLAAGLAAGLGGASHAGSVFSVDLTFVFDDETTQEAIDASVDLPNVSGTVVYDINLAELNGSGQLEATPDNGGLVSLDVAVLSDFGSIAIDEKDDVDFSAFPLITIDSTDSTVVSFNYVVALGDASGEIFGDQFSGNAAIFNVEGSGTVLFGDPVMITNGDTGGGSPPKPNVIPTPTAAAAGFALMGLLASRRRRAVETETD
ncbi:MAG: MYXO-CTERM sorting domain-containing protein [Planctomycetota bacterium]